MAKRKAVLRQRQDVLDVAYQRHPERFVRSAPQPPALPSEVWITSRSPLRTAVCVGAAQMKQQRRYYSAEERPESLRQSAVSSELLWKIEMHLGATKVGMLWVDRVADRRCLGDPGAKFLWKL